MEVWGVTVVLLDKYGSVLILIRQQLWERACFGNRSSKKHLEREERLHLALPSSFILVLLSICPSLFYFQNRLIFLSWVLRRLGQDKWKRWLLWQRISNPFQDWRSFGSTFITEVSDFGALVWCSLFLFFLSSVFCKWCECLALWFGWNWNFSSMFCLLLSPANFPFVEEKD